MAIIGIDQSLTGTGLAYISNDGVLVKNSIIKTGKYLGTERLAFITDEIMKFCGEVNERFVIAREGYSFGSKGRATFSLGELGGCIDLCLFKSNMPNLVKYYHLSPNAVKKFCLGSGSIKKDSGYLLKVFNKFNIEFPDDNQADAFMIAQTLLGFLKASRFQSPEHIKFVAGLTLVEKEALIASILSTKGSGVTKATIKKIDHESFGKYTSQTLENCLAFSGKS